MLGTWKKCCSYVPRDQVPAVQKAIEGYRLFEQLVEQYAHYAQQVIHKTREEMATGSKKPPTPEILCAQESEIQQLINPGKKKTKSLRTKP